MKVSKDFFKYVALGATVLYVVAIFIFATMPTEGYSVAQYNDKLLHFLEFFLLTVILLFTFLLWQVKDEYLLIFIITTAVALGSEIVQRFIINRTFSIYDLIADLSGIAVGFLLFFGGYTIWKYFKR